MLALPKLASRRFDFRPVAVARINPLWTATTTKHLRYDASGRIKNRRWKSTETGDNKTGHIEASSKDNEGIFFLDSIFPLKLSLFSGLPLMNLDKMLFRFMQSLQNPEIAAAEPKKIAERALRTPFPVEVIEVLPRVREGGTFIKFKHEPGRDVKVIEKTVKQHLKDNPIRPWFNPARKVKTFLVNGRPWVEDLYRIPSPKVKVEFVPPQAGSTAEELSQETLYSLFRKYGKLVDIASQPTDSKDLPKFAHLYFNTVRHAIRAKNCMHGFVLSTSEGGGQNGTMLKLSYEQKRKAHYIWDWLVNHPRLVVPILIAIFGTLTVAVFDPQVSVLLFSTVYY